MPRAMLTEESWAKLWNVLKGTGRVYDKSEHRMTVEGILYRLRTGIPWRDLPQEFGHWNTVFRRFNLWSRKGVLEVLRNALVCDPDLEWLFVDSTIVRAHQHSTGAATALCEAIGRSRGGNSTKIHLAVDSYGLPVHFELSPGQAHDAAHAESLLFGAPIGQCTIADKAYDSKALRKTITELGSEPVIPRRKGSTMDNRDMDWGLYRYRHLVENAFARIKHFRAVATRYDKLERNYAAMIALACVVMWLPMSKINSP